MRASPTRWSPPRSPATRWPRRTDRGSGSPAAERALQSYPIKLKAELGGYYTLGRTFVKLIGHPQVMRVCTKYGLPRKTLMRFTLKLLANLTDSRDGDAMDKIDQRVCPGSRRRHDQRAELRKGSW